MHLAPPGCEPTCIERWFGQRDNTHVTTTLRIVDYDLKARTERLRINLLVREFETNGKAAHTTAATANRCSRSARRKSTACATNSITALTPRLNFVN